MKTKVLKVTLVTIFSVIIVLVAAVAIVWGREIATLSTVETVDGNEYLYKMEYKAAYDLDDVIAANIDSNKGLLAYVAGRVTKGLPINVNPAKKEDSEERGFSCTSFQAANPQGDGFLFGRNYDFFKNPSLVTVSHPKDGYASIAMCDMSHFGYSLDKVPEKFLSRLLCLAAIYAPMDGMNEKGLCTSILALPDQPAQQNTGKNRVSTSIIMRLFLDRCATVDEALALLEQFDIRHDVEAGSGYHYMVADANGDAAVIEFDLEDGWKTMITRKAEGSNSMLVTNHLLAPKYYTEIPDQRVGNTHSHSWWRYETVKTYLQEHNGMLTVEEAQECLSKVHWQDFVWDSGLVEDTQYSCVYDQNAIELYIRNWNDYSKTEHFCLK